MYDEQARTNKAKNEQAQGRTDIWMSIAGDKSCVYHSAFVVAGQELSMYSIFKVCEQVQILKMKKKVFRMTDTLIQFTPSVIIFFQCY